MRMMLVLALALAPTIALAESGPGTAAPGELGNPVTGAPLGANDPPDFEPTPPPLVARLPPADAERIRSQLMGKPVYGSGGGRIGEVSGIAVGNDGSLGAVTVTMAGSGGEPVNLAVPWNLVQPQAANPTIVLPWDVATLRWLTGPR